MESNLSKEPQFLKKLIDIIDANLHNENFGVSELAEELGLSRVTLHRKVKSVVRKSVSKLIRETRLKRAFQLLQQRNGNVSEIAFMVGFGSVAYFTRCFHTHYGFTPGEVLKRMHPVKRHLQKESEKTFLSKLKSKLIYIIPLVILLSVIIILVLQYKRTNPIEKSIAVLPPKDISSEGSECILLEGFREEVQSKLYVIGELQVASGTTIDTYRNSQKKLRNIAKEVGVNYVVEISGQTINKKSTIWVNLIEAEKDRQIWTSSFHIESPDENIDEFIQETAFNVAKELKAKLSPEDKKNIRKQSTDDPLAYWYYQLGLKCLGNYETDHNPKDYLRAKKNFENAIRLDSTYADAYAKLGRIYIYELSRSVISKPLSYFSFENYLDSGFIMLEKAIKFNVRNIDEVLYRKAQYYQFYGNHNEAIKQIKRLWKEKQKNVNYYLQLGDFYYYKNDFYNALENLFTYIEIKPDDVSISEFALNQIIWSFINTGFTGYAKEYANKLYPEIDDSLKLKTLSSYIDYFTGNFEEAENGFQELFQNDSANYPLLGRLFRTKIYLGKLQEAAQLEPLHLHHAMKYFGERLPDHYQGYLYTYLGQNEKAGWEYQTLAKYMKEEMDISKNPYHQNKFGYFVLAEIYSMTGKTEKAIESIRIYAAGKQLHNCNIVVDLKMSPLLDNIRNEPEFKKIQNEIETKYRSQRERIKKMLISYGLSLSSS